jgi:hypothetical protein
LASEIETVSDEALSENTGAGRRGWLELTVVSDSAKRAETGRMVLIAVDSISSVNQTSGNESPARLVVRETEQVFAPWIFRSSTEGLPRFREITTVESYRVVRSLIRWAEERPRIYRQADWDHYWEEWPKLSEDITTKTIKLKKPKSPTTRA